MYLKMLHRLIKWRNPHESSPRSPLDDGLGITIRFAYPDDAAAVRRLAALDSKPVPAGPLLIAEVGGELWAAVSVPGARHAIADPFRHTAELVALLRERVERLTTRPRPRPSARPLQSRPVYD
jgi:hypothetical protein